MRIVSNLQPLNIFKMTLRLFSCFKTLLDVYYLFPYSVKWISDNDGNLKGKGKQEEQRLPGFEEFTPLQMFWVSYAQMYCAKWTDNGVFKLLTEVMKFFYLFQ